MLTWQGLAASCDAFAAAMERMGVKPGDVVGFMLPNGLSALTVFLGAMAGGYVVAPFNLLAQDAQLDYVLGHARPRVVFAAADYARRLEAACARSWRGSCASSRWVSMGSASKSPRRAPRRERVADQPCDADVHVRHDGRTEGRAAYACEHAVRRRDCRRASATRPGRSRAVFAAALSHQRPVHCRRRARWSPAAASCCRTGSALRNGGRWSNATVRRGSTWCRRSSPIC